MSKISKKNLTISIILGVYLSLVTSKVESNIFGILIIPFKAFLFSFFIYKLIIYIDKKNLLNSKDKIKREDYLIWLTYIIVVMSVALYVYYPVNFTIDLNTQFNQTITNNYSDWHPLIHTLLFYKLPTLIISSKLSCSIFQMILLSIILLYFCNTLSKYGLSKKKITIVLSLFILNSGFDLMAISPIKDTAFSYCIFLMTIFLMNIYITNGEWINKKTNFWLFLVASFGVAFFRHNGIATFLVTIICMIFIYKKIRKKSIYIFLIIVSLRFIFIPAIYKANNINKTQGTLSEMVCILLNQISYIYNNNGNISDNQIKELKKYQDLNDLKKYYNAYNYCLYKFNTDYYGWQSYAINSNKKQFLTLWKDIVKNNKMMALKSYLYSTYCIWHIGLDNNNNNTDLYYIASIGNNNDLNFQETYFNYKHNLNSFPFSILNITICSSLFLLLGSLLYSFTRTKKKWHVIVPYIPVFSNIFLIFLLLPGRDTRFLYSNILCAFPLIIFMFLVNKDNLQKKKERI